MNYSQTIKKSLISLIIPVKNEELNIDFFYKSVCKVISTLDSQYDFEFIFTDNCSNDRTFELIKSLSISDNRIRAYRFSRDFGYQKSILTGYLKSRGDAVIQLDCDLQDPPELITDFLFHWKNGFKVVYGIRSSRGENIFSNSVRRFFYRFVNLLSEEELPLDAGDFRLVDKIIVNVLSQISDNQPYLRGCIATMGFKQIGVPYSRRIRIYGSTKFKFKDQIYLALDAILNHSIIPLRIASFLGIFLSVVSILCILIYTLGKLIVGYDWPPGFTSIIILILFSICLNAIFLGIIGEYLGRIFHQTKKKPLVIIECSIND